VYSTVPLIILEKVAYLFFNLTPRMNFVYVIGDSKTSRIGKTISKAKDIKTG
jgi:hypothetical protein